VLQVAIDVGAVVEESVARHPSPPSPSRVVSVRLCWLPRSRVCRVRDVDGRWGDVLQEAVDVEGVVEESVARPSFTSLSQGCICEAMLAASFACLSCQRRRRSVGWV
jgi:hypothetical protein